MQCLLEKKKQPVASNGVKERVRAYWNDRAETFALQRETEFCGAHHALWADELLSQIGSAQGLRILDVGCGCGFLSMILAELGQTVTGIDLSPQMILRGQVLARKYHIPVRFLQMDAERPLFPEAYFDVVVSRNLTWTLPHPTAAYVQWLQLLKPGGFLLNYDAEHAKFHRRVGLAHEPAHQMLSQTQRDACMALYDALPASELAQPAWDAALLERLGCTVRVDDTAGMRLSSGYPIFRIRAQKHPASL